jgi:hypothetical protein
MQSLRESTNYTRSPADFRQLPAGPLLARAELAKHTTEIRMTPEVSTDGTLQYVADGEWNFFGGTDFAVVAGVGFEPTTFGL